MSKESTDTNSMKNKKYLRVDLYNGKTTNCNLQKELDVEGITKEEYFDGYVTVTSSDGYTSYYGEDLYIELPA